MYVHVKREVKMAKYTNDANQLLTLVGGKSNIKSVTHCITRMRFVLHDLSKADIKAFDKS